MVLESPLRITNWALVNENFLDTDEKEEEEYEHQLIVPSTNKNNTLTGTLLNGESSNFSSCVKSRLTPKIKPLAKRPEIRCPEVKPSPVEGPLDRSGSLLAPETNSETSDLSMSTVVVETIFKEMP